MNLITDIRNRNWISAATNTILMVRRSKWLALIANQKKEFIVSTFTISSNSSVTCPAGQSAKASGVFSAIAAFLNRIGDTYENSRKERREAYLEQAADIYDLEYRMKRLDQESTESAAWIRGF